MRLRRFVELTPVGRADPLLNAPGPKTATTIVGGTENCFAAAPPSSQVHGDQIVPSIGRANGSGYDGTR